MMLVFASEGPDKCREFSPSWRGVLLPKWWPCERKMHSVTAVSVFRASFRVGPPGV